MEQLLVRLGSQQEDRVQWLVWSADEQEIIASGELPDAAHLDTLKERAGQRPVIALAPTCDISMRWVALPPRASRKVLTAIPFMLEDELAQDISKLFFAMGPRRADQQAVAIVSREKMDDWQAWLADAGLYCDKLLPDVLAVPYQEGAWSVLTVGDDLLIREDEWQGMEGELSWLLPAFSHRLRNAEVLATVNNYAEMDLTAIPNIDVQQAQLELPMHLLASEAVSVSFNLLQNEYRVKRKHTGSWHQWRVAAALAILALATSLIDKGATIYQLKQQNARLSAQIDQAVQSGFPNLGAYRDLRLKIRSEMAQMEQTGGSASMLAMMGELSSAFATSQIQPQTLRFDGSRAEIRMQALGRDFESLEQFKRQAESAGFEVEQGAINNRDNAVIGTVAIRG